MSIFYEAIYFAVKIKIHFRWNTDSVNTIFQQFPEKIKLGHISTPDISNHSILRKTKVCLTFVIRGEMKSENYHLHF
jgi:hypothetical protein